MAQIKLEFEGMDEMLKEIERQEKSLKSITEKALKMTFETVQPGIRAAMPPHKRTGRTEKALIDNAVVEWQGSTASIGAGFSIREGGLASQFLIYGAKKSVTGVPYRAPDMQLYNAVRGRGTFQKVAELQRKVFEKELLR